MARLVGISDAAVSGLVDRGVLGRGQSLLAWLHAYCDHIRQVAAGRGGGSELTQARVREANAKAAKAEVETGEKISRLIFIGHLEPALRSIAARAVQSIEAAAIKAKGQIEARHGIILDDSDIRDHLRGALREIAEMAERWQSEADDYAEDDSDEGREAA